MKIIKNQCNEIEVFKTPQSLVHVKHDISLQQYKYWYLLMKIYKDQLSNGTPTTEKGFRIVSMSEVINLLGYEPNRSELKNDFRNLRQQPIVFNYLEKDGEPVMHEMGFLSEFKVSSNRIWFKFPSLIEEVLDGNPRFKDIFLLLNWNIFNSFSGKYEAIIYKLCKDYLGVGRTPYFSLNEYREYVGLKDGEYQAIDDFNKRCVKNPIKSINNNELSDILVDVEFKREKRKIVGLWFTVSPKKQMVLPIEDLEPNPAFKFAKIAITPEQQIKYLEQYTAEQVAAIIERANEYGEDLKQKGKKANFGAIYHKAFAENWGEEKLLEQQAEKRRKEAAIQEAKRKAEQEKADEQKWLAEKRELAAVEAVFEAMSEEKQNEILDQIETQISGMILSMFRKDRKEGKPVHKKGGIGVYLKKIILGKS